MVKQVGGRGGGGRVVEEKKQKLVVRLRHVRQKKYDSLDDVRLRLHTSDVPDRLPCREREFDRISDFLRHFLSAEISQCMYISGVPGTGKTATVFKALENLESKGQTNFAKILTNAMQLSDPRQIYVQVYQAVTGTKKKKIAANTACQKLNEIFLFKHRSRQPTVLVVDELDLLCTKRQDVIYNVFNWASSDESRLAVIAIANTLDLPERLLNQRGPNRLIFQPYDHDQIAKIVLDRIAGSPSVSSDAIEFASRKVASLAGDLRKSLDILRRATEIAVEQMEPVMEMRHVQMAIKEMISTVAVDAIRALSLHSRCLLRAVIHAVDRKGIDEVTMETVMPEYIATCRNGISVELKPLTPSFVHGLVLQMSTSRLLILGTGGGMINRRIRLGLTKEETLFALRQADKEM